MSRFTHPYEGARVAARATGLIPEGPETGKAVTVTLYDGLASHGYRSNYERRPKAWLTIEAPEVKCDGGRKFRQCWSFSGNRYDAARREFDRACADLHLTPDDPRTPLPVAGDLLDGTPDAPQPVGELEPEQTTLF